MKICLDTNAYSKLLQGGCKGLVDLVELTPQVFIPAIVIGELAAGFQMGSRTRKNLDVLDDFLFEANIEVIDVTRDIADRYGILVKQLREQGTPIPTNDIWIAAVVLETGSRLVTYDTHFAHIPGLYIIAP